MALIKIQRGQSVKWNMVLSSGGSPMDLTGASWEVLEPTSRPEITISVTDAIAGKSELTIDKNETRDLRPGDKTIRARVIFPDGSAIASSPIVVDIV